jgi:hypothetical protein
MTNLIVLSRKLASKKLVNALLTQGFSVQVRRTV